MAILLYDFMREIWAPIRGYEGLYMVSSLGQVKSLSRVVYRADSALLAYNKSEQILICCPNEKGYLRAALCKDGRMRKFRLSRLVAQAFIPNPDNKPEVNHIDGNKQNNNVDNLEWSTRLENQSHAIENHLWNSGLCSKDRGQSRIASFSKDGKLVKEYASINDAAKDLNVFRSSISRSIKRSHMCTGGLLWKRI